MRWLDIYLLCFAVGVLWSLLSLVLGGFHLGHSGSAHAGHHGLLGHAQGAGKSGAGKWGNSTRLAAASWVGSMVNPSCAAVFLAWFGGVGYLLLRHSGLGFWIDLIFAVSIGLAGALLLAAFLRFLQSREQPLDPADYDLTGVLGRVSSTIHPRGVGEIIYVRDGARRPLAARAEDGNEIRRGEEVIVTHYEKGIAYVRTWEAMTQPAEVDQMPESLQKERTGSGSDTAAQRARL